MILVASFNALGQVSCATTPYHIADAQDTWLNNSYQTTACTSKTHTSTTYDALGRPLQITAPDGSITEKFYSINDNLGEMRAHHNVIDANQHRMRSSTNARGQLA
ncbi:MAG: hypothetical protein GY943_37260 [Chloroflexi bacterium]|nr:hypothetical protein [Chloroflexota bacterium]